MKAAVVLLALFCFASAAARGRRGGGGGRADQIESPRPPRETETQLRSLLADADRSFETQQYAKAQQALEQAVALWPAEPVAQYKLGMLLQQGQRHDLALPHLEAALTSVPRRHPMHADILGASGRLEIITARGEQMGSRRTTLMASGLEHLRAALQTRPELAKSDPMLSRLLTEAEAEVRGRRRAPTFDAAWAKGHNWMDDPEFASELEAVVGITASEDSGTVERREIGSLQWDEFRERYRGSGEAGGSVGRPVLLTNATAGWSAHGPEWDKHRLLQRYGGVTAAIRWAVGTRQFGLLERQESLGRYVQTISKALTTTDDSKELDPAASSAKHVARAGMLFGNLCDVQQVDGCSLGLVTPSASSPSIDEDKPTEGEDAAGEWWMPPLMAKAGITNPGISIGPSRAGLPWHNHDAAWQAVVRDYGITLMQNSLLLLAETYNELVAPGAKLFLLLPPLASDAQTPPQSEIEVLAEALGHVLLPHPKDFVLQWTNSTKAAREIWASHSAHGQAGWELLQWVVVTPGDALFIPCNWWHATLNIGETVAVGGQQLQGKEGGSCPRDLYAEAAAAMAGVSRGLQQRKAATATGRAATAALSPSEASEGLGALAVACAALRWNAHCDFLRAELLALAKRGDEAVALLLSMAKRMRSAHAEGLLSSVQLSSVLDGIADNLLSLPFGPYDGSVDSAWDFLDAAVKVEPVHNLRAPVFRALLARQQSSRPQQKEIEAAAVAAVERGEAGAPAAFWYRFAGAQGGTSISDLRERLGLPAVKPRDQRKLGGGGKGKSSKRKKHKGATQKKHKQQ